MLPITEIRCSGLHRPMQCPGFVFMKDLPPDEETAEAKEGTACGELLAHMLRQRTTTPQVPTHASNGVFFDNDMYFYARITAERILAEAVGEILCEQRIDWMTPSGILIRGSYDVVFMDAQGRLHIEDLKYGWVHVEVKPNWQLLGYAIGEYFRRISLGQHVQTFVLRIHQPRPLHEEGPIRTWELDLAELTQYHSQIVQRMQEIADGNSGLQTGKSCKYCPAAGSCAAINKAVYTGIDLAMGKAVQDHLTNQQLADQMLLIERAMSLLDIRKDSLEELVVNRIRGGQVIPGLTIEESWGHRKWKNNVSAEALESMTGKKLTESILITPAKAEKLGIHESFISQLTERYRIGNKVKRKDNNAMADQIFGDPSKLKK
jgi:hypothetical protein